MIAWLRVDWKGSEVRNDFVVEVIIVVSGKFNNVVFYPQDFLGSQFVCNIGNGVIPAITISIAVIGEIGDLGAEIYIDDANLDSGSRLGAVEEVLSSGARTRQSEFDVSDGVAMQ